MGAITLPAGCVCGVVWIPSRTRNRDRPDMPLFPRTGRRASGGQQSTEEQDREAEFLPDPHHNGTYFNI